MKRRLIAISLLTLTACYGSQQSGRAETSTPVSAATPIPSPSPTPEGGR